MTAWQLWIVVGMGNLALELAFSKAFSADVWRSFESDFCLPVSVNVFVMLLALALYVALWPLWLLLDVLTAVDWTKAKLKSWKNG